MNGKRVELGRIGCQHGVLTRFQETLNGRCEDGSRLERLGQRSWIWCKSLGFFFFFFQELKMVRFAMQTLGAESPHQRPAKRSRSEPLVELPTSPPLPLQLQEEEHLLAATFDPDTLDCQICMEALSAPIFQVYIFADLATIFHMEKYADLANIEFLRYMIFSHY